MPYFPSAAFASMMLALLERRSSLGFLGAGGSAIVVVMMDFDSNGLGIKSSSGDETADC